MLRIAVCFEVQGAFGKMKRGEIEAGRKMNRQIEEQRNREVDRQAETE